MISRLYVNVVCCEKFLNIVLLIKNKKRKQKLNFLIQIFAFLKGINENKKIFLKTRYRRNGGGRGI